RNRATSPLFAPIPPLDSRHATSFAYMSARFHLYLAGIFARSRSCARSPFMKCSIAVLKPAGRVVAPSTLHHAAGDHPGKTLFCLDYPGRPTPDIVNSLDSDLFGTQAARTRLTTALPCAPSITLLLTAEHY